MEYVDGFIETFTLLVSSVGSVLFTILNVNFWLLDSVVCAVRTTIALIVNAGVLLFQGIILAADEFQLFISEISGGIQAVFFVLRNAGKILISVITVIFTSVYSLLSNITTESGSLISSIGYCLKYTVTGIKNFTVLLGQSIVLILESLPWSITTFYHGTVDLTSFLLKSFVDGCNSSTRKTVQSVKNVFINLVDKIHSIPRDAYLGLMIIIVIFLIHRYMRSTIKRFIRKAFKFLIKISRRTIRGYQHVFCLLVRCLRNINTFRLVLMQYLHQISNSGIQDENNSDASDREDSEDRIEENDHDSGTDEPAPGTIYRLRRELESQKGAQTCIVCLENPKNMIFLPCRHMCACQECCTTLVYRRAPCPVCRKFIRNTIRVYT